MAKYVTTAYWPSGSITKETHPDWNTAFEIHKRLMRNRYSQCRPDRVTITLAQEEKPDVVSTLTKILISEVKNRYVGKIITVDGTQPGTSNDGSWRGDFFKVLSINDKLEFMVEYLVDFSMGYRDGNKIGSSTYTSNMRASCFDQPVSIDSKHFIIRLVTPEEVIKAMFPLRATSDDINYRQQAKSGYRMVSEKDRKSHGLW